MAESRIFYVEAVEGQSLVADPQGVMQLGTGTGSSGGRWEPVTNGDVENPEIIFYNGDVEMYFVSGA